MVAAKIANLGYGGDRSKSPIGDLLDPQEPIVTQAAAATMLNVGKRSVERAREVIDRGTPGLIAAWVGLNPERLRRKRDEAENKDCIPHRPMQPSAVGQSNGTGRLRAGRMRQRSTGGRRSAPSIRTASIACSGPSICTSNYLL